MVGSDFNGNTVHGYMTYVVHGYIVSYLHPKLSLQLATVPVFTINFGDIVHSIHYVCCFGSKKYLDCQKSELKVIFDKLSIIDSRMGLTHLACIMVL